MPDIVANHVRRWAAIDFVWGQSDCSLVLADYVRDVTGIDGAEHLRGRYGDRTAAEAVAGLDRGLEHVISACASRCGLMRTIAPVRGDIGVMKLRHLEFAGLCLGDRWAVKSPDGVLFLDGPELIAAWAVRG